MSEQEFVWVTMFGKVNGEWEKVGRLVVGKEEHLLKMTKRAGRMGCTETKIMTDEEIVAEGNARRWDDLEKNDPIKAELFLALFPGRNPRTADPNTVGRFALKKLIKIGLAAKCSRCGGSGKFGLNPNWGETCMKCGDTPHVYGHGFQFPRLSKKLIEKVKEALR